MRKLIFTLTFLSILLNSGVAFSFPINASTYICNSTTTPIDENFILLESSVTIVGNERYAVGKIKNVGNKDARCIRIIASFYDKDNELVTKAGDFRQNMLVGEEWNFHIKLCSITPMHFKITEIYYELY